MKSVRISAVIAVLVGLGCSGSSPGTGNGDTTLPTGSDSGTQTGDSGQASEAASTVSSPDSGPDAVSESGDAVSEGGPEAEASVGLCGNGRLDPGEQCDDGSGDKKCTGCEGCQWRRILGSGSMKSNSTVSMPPDAACVEGWFDYSSMPSPVTELAGTQVPGIVLRDAAGNWTRLTVGFIEETGYSYNLTFVTSSLGASLQATVTAKSWHHVASTLR